MAKKKKSNMLGGMQDYAIGLGGLGVTMGAAGAIGATSPVAVTGGLSTMASFTPVMGTMVGAGSVLKQVKKLNKKKY